jgi:hypothetical protein
LFNLTSCLTTAALESPSSLTPSSKPASAA